MSAREIGTDRFGNTVPARFVNIGGELGLGELVPDLAHDGRLGVSERAAEDDFVAHLGEMSVALFMNDVVDPLDTVGVGELFPALDDAGEVGHRKRLHSFE